MSKIFSSALIVSSLLLVACAQTRGYTPAIDTKNSSNAANVTTDLQQCEEIARQASGNTAVETAIGTGIGGAIGAATGAIVGAVSGNDVAKSAMIGGTAGGIGGAAKQGYESDSKYKKAYNDCMTGRGHKVLQ
jgi:outer membrane lipoprotein SlyB